MAMIGNLVLRAVAFQSKIQLPEHVAKLVLSDSPGRHYTNPSSQLRRATH